MEIYDLYKALREKYGKPLGQWTLWCKRPKTGEEREIVIVESILTQRANWNNVCMAVTNLKNAGMLGLQEILSAGDKELQYLIKPSGFYKTKCFRLKLLSDFIINECGGVEKTMKISSNKLRKKLLSLNGIGDETADDILLYAFDKPVFVIDEYTRRIVKKLHLTDNLSYRHLQTFFEEGLGRKKYALYQDFHALIVIEGKSTSQPKFFISIKNDLSDTKPW